MTPSWVSRCGTVTLYRGDSSGVRPDPGWVTVTDPPYNIGSPRRVVDCRTADHRMVGRDFGDDFDDDSLAPSEWFGMVSDVVVSFYGAKGMAALLIAAGGAGYEVVQDFHWCKSNAPPPMRAVGFSWAVESGYVFRRIGVRHLVNKMVRASPNFFVCPIDNSHARTHSTGKPVRVMTWLVNNLTTTHVTVYDPFMGSGTTGVSAVGLGRCFVGVERKPEYFDDAVRRIGAALVRRRGSMGLTR